MNANMPGAFRASVSSSVSAPQARLTPSQTEVSFSHQESTAVNHDNFLFTAERLRLNLGFKTGRKLHVS